MVNQMFIIFAIIIIVFAVVPLVINFKIENFKIELRTDAVIALLAYSLILGLIIIALIINFQIKLGKLDDVMFVVSILITIILLGIVPVTIYMSKKENKGELDFTFTSYLLGLGVLLIISTMFIYF